MEISHFPIECLAKKIVFLDLIRKHKISRFCPPPYENSWLYMKKSIFQCPCRQFVWLIVGNWWTTLLWSGSTKGWSKGRFRNFVDLRWSISLTYTSKAWLSWSFLVQLSELMCVIAPIAPPWIRAWFGSKLVTFKPSQLKPPTAISEVWSHFVFVVQITKTSFEVR